MAERTEVIRGEIQETREQMAETVEALEYKANVPARAKDWVADKRDSVVSGVTGAKASVTSQASGITPDGDAVKQRSLRLKDTAERNPLGLVVAGAAVGFIAGMLSPSTEVEDEKIGPVADQVKSSAAEAGQEVLDHGKEIAQAAAQSAVETAKEEGKQHGEELSSSLQEKAQEVTQSES